MAKKSKLLLGLEDALAYESGDKSRARVSVVQYLDVAALRGRLHMSQNKFAKTFNITPATLKNWEQGLRTPTGPARTLLRVIDKNPEAVLEALSE